MSKNSVKKGKKQADEHLTVEHRLFNEFFLGDIVLTLLPIGIIALLKCVFRTLDRSFFLVSDWAFASIIISSLALTRMLELKIIHQKDTTFTGIALSRICILLVILSTICLSLHVLKEQGVKIEDFFIFILQLFVLVAGISLLFIAHYYKEKLIINRKEFPDDISARELHFYSVDNLTDARKNIRIIRMAFNKRYEFFSRDNDIEDIKEYGKDEINRIVEDMQHDLKILKERMEAWNKPPYADQAVSDVPDAAAK